jgi:hypothetical protein
MAHVFAYVASVGSGQQNQTNLYGLRLSPRMERYRQYGLSPPLFLHLFRPQVRRILNQLYRDYLNDHDETDYYKSVHSHR